MSALTMPACIREELSVGLGRSGFIDDQAIFNSKAVNFGQPSQRMEEDLKIYQ
jgi:hypothetical protein